MKGRTRVCARIYQRWADTWVIGKDTWVRPYDKDNTLHMIRRNRREIQLSAT